MIWMYCKERDMKYEGYLAKECNKKIGARMAKKDKSTSANIGVGDMNADCFVIHSSPLSPQHYVSFLEGCRAETDYPSLTVYEDLDIQDLNWPEFTGLDTLSVAPSQMEGIETQATGKWGETKWIFDTGASDNMPGTQVTKWVLTKAIVNAAAGRKVQVTGVRKRSLHGLGQRIQISNVLMVSYLGTSRLLTWQKLAALRY